MDEALKSEQAATDVKVSALNAALNAAENQKYWYGYHLDLSSLLTSRAAAAALNQVPDPARPLARSPV